MTTSFDIPSDIPSDLSSDISEAGSFNDNFPPLQANIELHLNAQLTSSLSFGSGGVGGGTLTQIDDLSGNGRNAIIQSLEPNWTPSLGVEMQFNAPVQMQCGAAGDLDALHNVSEESTFYALIQPKNNLSNRALFTTQSSAFTDSGVAYVYNNASSNQEGFVNIGNGTQSVIQTISTGNLLPPSQWSVLTIRKTLRSGGVANFMFYINGELVSSLAPSANYGAGSSGIFQIGRYTNTLSGAGDFYFDEIIAYSEGHTVPQMDEINQYLANKRGVSLFQRVPQPLVLMLGQSNSVGFDDVSNSTRFNGTNTIAGVAIYDIGTNSIPQITYNQVGANNKARDDSSMGSELALGSDMTAIVPGNVYISKFSIEGALIESFLPGGSNNGNMSQEFQRAVWRIEDTGDEPILFLLYWQGESDSQTEENANLYQERLETLIFQTLPSLLSGRSFEKIAYNEIGRGGTPYPFQDIINESFDNVTSIDPRAHVLTSLVTYQPADEPHAEANSYDSRGTEAKEWFIG